MQPFDCWDVTANVARPKTVQSHVKVSAGSHVSSVPLLDYSLESGLDGCCINCHLNECTYTRVRHLGLQEPLDYKC